jgi:uncharacterized protein (TIGR02466 family)
VIQEHKRWMEASEVDAMFPSLVWKIQIEPGLRDALNKSIEAVLFDIRRELPPLATGLGWQSDHTLHRRDELRELVRCVERGVASILRFLRIGYDAFEITACWATVLAKGAAHRAHSHPNNFLSGVYYVRTEPGADRINFHDPRPQVAVIRPPVVELTAENADQVVVQVRSGTLLLFPSWFVHSVDVNPNEAERVSVSFNIMLSAFTERLSQPLWSGGRSS